MDGLQPASLVAVTIPGITNSLYGVLVEDTGDEYRVHIHSQRGEATMICPHNWVEPWRHPNRGDRHR